MPLTESQIQTLFAFTQKKLVHWYDLQVELVDHLASAIEEEMDKNPSVTFEQALQKVYAGFGIFGFAHVVQERSAALEKQHNKLWWQTLRAFFTLPKIIFTIVIFLCAYSVSPHLDPPTKQWFIYTLLIGCGIMGIIRTIRNRKMVAKPLMLTQFTPHLPFTATTLPFFTGIVGAHSPIRYAIVFACLITIIVVVQLALIHTHQQIRQKALSLYPEAFATV